MLSAIAQLIVVPVDVAFFLPPLVVAAAADVVAVGVVVFPATSRCCDDDAPSNSWAVVAAWHQQHGHVAVDASASSTGDVAGVFQTVDCV